MTGSGSKVTLTIGGGAIDGGRKDAPPKPTKITGSPGFRKDLEGLRGIGILAVLVWHAGVPYMPGGFVFLDMFFVLSGFLITQLLVKELQTTGRLRLRRFYGRRAKRLLPAATVVLVVVVPLAWLLLPRTRWTSTAQDVVFTALYGMNWRLAGQSTDYFAQDQADSILEHFWSLSVEEQFYLVWPVLLAYIAVQSFRKGRRSMAIPLLAAFTLIAVPSFLWSAYYSVTDPNPAYFVTTTRAWEFAIGGACAMLMFTAWRLSRAAALAMGWAGMSLLFFGAFYLTTDFPYPGYWALIPCVGTAAIIVAGFTAGPRGPVALLGTAPIQFFGRISYSLYLVHWPVIALTAGTVGRVLTPSEGLLVATASILPAYLLHRYIENPIRHSTTMFKNSAHMLRAALIATVVTLLAAMALHLANWPPVPPSVSPTVTELAAGGGASAEGAVDLSDPAALEAARADPNAVLGAALLATDARGDQNGAPRDSYPTIAPPPLAAIEDFDDCIQNFESSDVRSCTYGERGSDTVIAVVGDSHASQWVPGLSEVAEQRGWELREYTKGACTFSDVLIATKEQDPYTSCQEWSANLLDQLLGPDKPTMVIAAAFGKGVMIDGEAQYGVVADDILTAGLRRYYEALNNADVPVVVIKDTPLLPIHIPDCVSANPDNLTACATDRSAALPPDHDREQINAIEGLPSSRTVDFNDAICPTDSCGPVIGNILVYRDTTHLTRTYVRSMTPRLDAMFGPIVDGVTGEPQG